MDDFTGADLSSAMSGGSEASASPDASPALTPETTTAATGTGTTPPAAVSVPERPAGPIPFDVHKTALENARIKGAEELRQRIGWAEKVSESEYRQVQGLARRLASENPEEAIAAVSELISEMTARPTHAAAVRSFIAKTLGSGRGEQAAPTMPEADVAVTDANGNVVGGAYSDKAMAHFAQFIIAQVDKKYAPVVQTHKTLEAQRQHDHDVAEGQKFATTLGNELKAYPHFEAHKQAIGQEVVSMLQQYGDDPKTNDPAFLEALTLRAYHRVVTTRQDALSRQAAVQDIHTKATASGVTPGRAPVGAPKRTDDGRFTADDLATEFARRRIG